MPSPSLLAVTSELPWPLDSGGHLRSFHLLRALTECFRVRLVAGVPTGETAAVQQLERAGIQVRAAVTGRENGLVESARAAGAALRRQPYVLFKRHDRGAVRRALHAEIAREAPDLMYFDHLDSFAFADVAPRVPSVLDMHNVYSSLADRAAADAKRRTLQLYLKREARLLGEVEQQAMTRVSSVLAVSASDGRYLSALGARRMTVVPNGVDCDAYDPFARDLSGAPVLLYIGSLKWPPNASAASFLAATVLPRVRLSHPSARLRIIGDGTAEALQALAQYPGVEVLGRVADVRPYLRDAHVLAVPLEAGGGTRLKILESFAAGVPVVSTAVGCEGLEVRNGRHLIIADREQFAGAIGALLDNVPLQRTLAGNARRLVCERFDWKTVGANACAAANDAVRA